MVKALDVHLGINSSAPPAFSFHHHLVCESTCLAVGPPDPRPGFPTPHRACPPAYLTNSLNAPQLNLPFLLTLPPTSAPHPAAPLCPPYSPGYAVAPRPEFSFSSTSLPHFLSPVSQLPALSTLNIARSFQSSLLFFFLLNPSPFYPHWNCPRSSHQHLFLCNYLYNRLVLASLLLTLSATPIYCATTVYSKHQIWSWCSHFKDFLWPSQSYRIKKTLFHSAFKVLISWPWLLFHFCPLLFPSDMQELMRGSLRLSETPFLKAVSDGIRPQMFGPERKGLGQKEISAVHTSAGDGDGRGIRI